MKESFHGARGGVDSAQVGAFMQVAAMAREREVFNVIKAAMLPGNYVLNVMRQFAVPLMKSTVLATLSGPVTDETPPSGVHRY
jgi:hypothetical protein